MHDHGAKTTSSQIEAWLCGMQAASSQGIYSLPRLLFFILFSSRGLLDVIMLFLTFPSDPISSA